MLNTFVYNSYLLYVLHICTNTLLFVLSFSCTLIVYIYWRILASFHSSFCKFSIFNAHISLSYNFIFYHVIQFALHSEKKVHLLPAVVIAFWTFPQSVLSLVIILSEPPLLLPVMYPKKQKLSTTSSESSEHLRESILECLYVLF